MTSPTNWPHPDQDPELYLRHTEKRILKEQRRPIVRKGSDILGPGFAPYATEISDWNANAATFNGYFWSAGDATNAPDDIGSSEMWLGWSVSQGTRGIQRAYNPALMDGWTRSWEVISGVRTYLPWVSDTEPYYPPYCSLEAGATTNIASDAAYHKIILDTEVHNDATYFSHDGTGVITVNQAGTYKIGYRAAYPSGTTAQKFFACGINGLTVLFETGLGSVAGDFAAVAEQDGFELDLGDTIQLNGYLGSGGAQDTVHSGNRVSCLTIRLI